MRGSAALDGMKINRETGPQAVYLIVAEPRAARLGASRLGNSIPKCN
jgi:hypothetical protein